MYLRPKVKLFFALLVPLLIAGALQQAAPCACVCVASSPSQGDLRAMVGETFLLLESAEAKGANVTAAAMSLNHALELISSGGALDLAQAESIINQVNSSIPGLASEGEAATYWGMIRLAATIVVLGIAGVLAYLLTPKLVWRIWARSKRDWRVAAQ